MFCRGTHSCEKKAGHRANRCYAGVCTTPRCPGQHLDASPDIQMEGRLLQKAREQEASLQGKNPLSLEPEAIQQYVAITKRRQLWAKWSQPCLSLDCTTCKHMRWSVGALLLKFSMTGGVLCLALFRNPFGKLIGKPQMNVPYLSTSLGFGFASAAMSRRPGAHVSMRIAAWSTRDNLKKGSMRVTWRQLFYRKWCS